MLQVPNYHSSVLHFLLVVLLAVRSLYSAARQIGNVPVAILKNVSPNTTPCQHAHALSLSLSLSLKRSQTTISAADSVSFKRNYTTAFIHSLVFSLEGRAWQEPEPSHVTGMALAHCILGKFLGVVCHCFPPPLDIPTLAARCLRPQRRERS